MAIIVFLNEEDQTLTCINGQKVIVLPWRNLSDIVEVVRDQEVYYVTSAEFVSGHDVIELIQDLTGITYAKKPQEKSQQYIRAVGNSKLTCRVPGGEVIFDGPTDFKLLSSLPRNIFDISDHMRKCLEIGKIEIVDSRRKAEIEKEIEAKNRPKTSRNESIDKILIKTSVDEFMKKESEPGDVQEIPIDGLGSFKSEDDQEVYSNIKKLKLNP